MRSGDYKNCMITRLFCVILMILAKAIKPGARLELPAVRWLSDGCQIDIGVDIFYFYAVSFCMSIILLRV